jgi:hypothetical protein
VISNFNQNFVVALKVAKPKHLQIGERMQEAAEKGFDVPALGLVNAIAEGDGVQIMWLLNQQTLPDIRISCLQNEVRCEVEGSDFLVHQQLQHLCTAHLHPRDLLPF